MEIEELNVIDKISESSKIEYYRLEPIAFFTKILSRKTVNESDRTVNLATELNIIKDNHKKFIKTAQDMLREENKITQQSIQYILEYIDSVEFPQSKYFKTSEIGYTGNISVIFSEDIEAVRSFYSKIPDKSDYVNFVYIHLAAYIYFNSIMFDDLSVSFGVSDKYRIDREIARVAALDVSSRIPDTYKSEISNAINRIDGLQSEATKIAPLEASLDEVRRTGYEADKQIKAVAERTTQLSGKFDEAMQSEIPAQINEAEARLVDFEGRLTAASESTRLAMVKKLWMDREATYSGAVTTAVMLLIAGFAVPIIAIVIFAIIVYYNPDLMDRMATALMGNVATDSGNGAFGASIQILSKLVFIGIPTALVFWTLRVLIRFYTRSLVLLDDARHRVTTMDTYLQLVREKALDEKDRPIVLEALLRRAPGQGPDSLEPATLSELLKLAQDGK